MKHTQSDERRVDVTFRLRSTPGTERIAVERVMDALAGIELPADQVERLKTAVAETTMNAIEHGNKNDPSLPVDVDVHVAQDKVVVRITDQGTDPITVQPAAPDIDAKVAGLQTPRGWGLFLIKNMVDEMRIDNSPEGSSIDLIFYREGAIHGRTSV